MTSYFFFVLKYEQCFFPRAIIERRLLNLPELFPLNDTNLRQSLGPGYIMGHFQYQGHNDRQRDCVLKPKIVEIIENSKKSLETNHGVSVSEFLKNIYESGYHEYGLLNIGESCGGPMPLAEAAARDPLFWRWHKHIKDFARATLDTKVMPKG